MLVLVHSDLGEKVYWMTLLLAFLNITINPFIYATTPTVKDSLRNCRWAQRSSTVQGQVGPQGSIVNRTGVQRSTTVHNKPKVEGLNPGTALPGMQGLSSSNKELNTGHTDTRGPSTEVLNCKL